MANLNLYLVTFNCGRALIKPEAFASHFFDALPDTTEQTQPPDLIVLHLQEIAPLAEGFDEDGLPQYYEHFKSAVDMAAKQKFSGSGSPSNDNAYVDLMTEHTGLTAIMLFARTDVQQNIRNIMSAGVGVGVQQMGNKGAAGVRIAVRIGDQRSEHHGEGGEVMHLTFISAHLAAMEEALDRRNQDFVDIAAGLVFEPNQSKSLTTKTWRQHNQGASGEQEPLLSDTSSRHSQEQESQGSDLIGMYAPDTHLFFAGDLNYRTSITKPEHDGSDEKFFPQPVPSSQHEKHFSHLLPRDQLTEQLQAGNTLHGLTEAVINFPPTYKYADDACGDKDLILDSEVSQWKWSAHRWPSWCDRILYSASSPAETRITIHRYTSLPLFATSDHRPVAMSVSVPLRPVTNHEFASNRPVEINPNWKQDRQSAKLKEAIVGTVWHSVSTPAGLMNLTMGIAGIVCIAVMVGVYSREW